MLVGSRNGARLWWLLGALVRVGAVLVVVVVLHRKHFHLGVLMVAAAAVIGLLFGMRPQQIAVNALASVFSASTLSVVGAMAFVGLLEALMNRAGMLDLALRSLSALVRDRRVIVGVVPAFMGLLPSAGGALMSCPMVDGACASLELSPHRRALANYWYRHVTEFIVPVYPAFVLASQISGVSVRSLAAWSAPAGLIAAAVMAPAVFKGVPRSAAVLPTQEGADRRSALCGLILGTAPIAVVVALVVACQWSVLAAVVCVVLGLAVVRFPGWELLAQMIRSSFLSKTCGMALGIMLFKDMLSAVGAVDEIAGYITAIGAPAAVTAVVLPLLLGAVTGMNSAAVGVAFPIISGLFSLSGGLPPQMAALAYIASVVGILITPMHLCMVVTADYFRADIGEMLRAVLAPAAAVLCWGILVSMLWRH